MVASTRDKRCGGKLRRPHEQVKTLAWLDTGAGVLNNESAFKKWDFREKNSFIDVVCLVMERGFGAENDHHRRSISRRR